MRILQAKIPEILVLEPKIYEDERGLFFESYQKLKLSEVGIHDDFVQDNHSSSKKGTLRGLHYQIKKSQGKLIRVARGEIFDVAVDLRRSSATFGKWVGTFLSESNKHQIWVPIGFAHGFYVTSERADVIYKTTDYYAPEFERTLLWNDSDIGIDWPLKTGDLPLISQKDSNGDTLADAELFE